MNAYEWMNEWMNMYKYEWGWMKGWMNMNEYVWICINMYKYV